jgi:hypothetical protein
MGRALKDSQERVSSPALAMDFRQVAGSVEERRGFCWLDLAPAWNGDRVPWICERNGPADQSDQRVGDLWEPT